MRRLALSSNLWTVGHAGIEGGSGLGNELERTSKKMKCTWSAQLAARKDRWRGTYGGGSESEAPSENAEASALLKKQHARSLSALKNLYMGGDGNFAVGNGKKVRPWPEGSERRVGLD